MMGKTYRVVAMVLAVFLCGIGVAEDNAELLALSFREFDQSPQSGWRKIAQAGECTVAAKTIESYSQAHADTLAAYEKFSLAFHAGQMYGMAGQKDAAVRSLRSALSYFPNGSNDGYVKALIAFTRDDREGLAQAKNQVTALDASNPAKATQLKSIDDLIAYFGCPLSTVGRQRQSVKECPAVDRPCR